MAGSYPSVGLKVDLNEIAQGQAALSSLRTGYKNVGQEAQNAGKAATDASRAARTAMADEQKAADQLFQFKRRMTAQQISQTVSLENQSYDVTRRLTQQRINDVKRGAEEENRTAQQTFEFRRRMTQQRASDTQRSVAAEEAANHRALGDFRSMMDQRIAAGRRAADALKHQQDELFAFQRRMTAQRAREAEQEAAAEVHAAEIARQAWARYYAFRAGPGGLRPDTANVRALLSAGGRGGGGGGGGSVAAAAAASGGLGASLLAGLAPVGSVVSSVMNSLSGLRNSLGAVRSAFFDARTAVGVFLAGLVIGPIVQAADAMNNLRARTALYAARASDVPYTFQQIYTTAQATRTPLEAVATLYTRLAPLAAQLGRSQTQILRTVQTVSQAFQIGGATPEEARSSSQQLAQALASNRLGGDELRSLAENAPVLVSRIAAALHMNTGQFINWAHAGHANTRVIVDAIDQAQQDIDRMFRTLPTTVGQGMTVLSNAFQHMVGDVDAATGASRRLAGVIVQFAAFVSSANTVSFLTHAINGLGSAFAILGQVVGTVVAYAPAIAAVFASMLGARLLPPIFAALAVGVRAFALSAALAGVASTTMSVGMGAAGAAAAGLLGGIRALVAMLGGPIGIALIAAAAAWSAYTDAERRAAAVAGDFQRANETGVSALQQAIAFSERYGLATVGLVTATDQLTGATRDKTTADDAAMVMARQRAEVERSLTVQLLMQAAAQERAVAAAANAAVNGGQRVLERNAARFNRTVYGVFPGARAHDDQVLANLQREDDANRRLVGQSILNATTLTNQAINIAGQDLNITRPGPGGRPQDNPAAGHNRGPTSGGLNAVARMREEVDALNAQIAALNTDPLSDMQARIRGAAETARAQRENGRNSPLADQAARLAALREEAQIRLELTRTLVQQQRADIQAAQASDVATQAAAAQTAVMQTFYAGSDQSLAGYAVALNRAHQTQIDAATSQAALTIAQQFGVTSIDQISAAMQRRMGTSVADADAMQAHAQATYAQRRATIEAADAENQLKDAYARVAEVNTQSDAAERYTTALRAGTLAIAEYNRQQAIRIELAAHPGLTLEGATATVNAQTLTAENQRSAQMAYQRTLAAATTREREQEARVIEIIQREIAIISRTGREVTADERARLEVQARITAELEAQRQALADLKTGIQDDIRKAFIETGRLDFGPLRERLTREMRRAVYDALIARPITIVVNAVVDVVTRGLSRILDQLISGVNGQGGGILGQIGQFLGGSSGSLGRLFNTASSGAAAAHEAAHAISGAATVLQTVGTALTAAYLGYQVGTAAAGALGVDMQNPGAGIGGMVGGGIGAVAGFVLGGPIGSAIGAAIGSGIGAWLGTAINGPYDPSATTSIRMQGGRFTPQTVKVDDNGPGDQVTQLAASVAQAMQAAATTFGVNVSQLGQFYTAIGYTATDRHGYTKGFFGGNIAGTSYGSSSEQIRAALYASSGAQHAGITDPQELATLLVKDMLHAAAASGALDLTDAELALIDAADNLDEAANTIKAARDVSTSISQALLGHQNPRQAALNALYTQQVARRQQVLNYGAQGLITPDRMARIGQDLQALERYEISDVIAQFATTVDGATHSMADFVNAQKQIKDFVSGLMTSSLSPLSPYDQLTSAGSSFFSTLNSARGGNYDALSSVTDVAQTYLQQAQSYYGSSAAYSSIFNTVTDALNQVSDQQLVSPDADAITAAIAALQDAVTAAGADIITAINAVNDNGGGGALTDEQVAQIVTAINGSAEVTALSGQSNADQIQAALSSWVASGGLLQGGVMNSL